MQSSDTNSRDVNDTYEIKRGSNDRELRIGYLVGGILGLVGAVIGLVVCIQFDIGQPGLTVLSTMPATMGVLLLIQYFSKGSRLSSVVSDARGLTFHYPKKDQLVRWEDLGLVERTISGMSKKSIVNLYDRNGKHVGTIDSGFENFDVIAQWLDERVRAIAGDSAVVMLKLKRHRRVGLGALVFGVVLLFAVTFLGFDAYNTSRSDSLLRTDSITGDAEIVELKTAPNGRTRRLVYQVVHEENRGPSENVEIDERTWELLQDQKTVKVNYVPWDLGVSQLVSGQVVGRDFTDTVVGKILLLVGVTIFALLLILCGILMRQGWNIETDPVTKKTRIERIGIPKA